MNKVDLQGLAGLLGPRKVLTSGMVLVAAVLVVLLASPWMPWRAEEASGDDTVAAATVMPTAPVVATTEPSGHVADPSSGMPPASPTPTTAMPTPTPSPVPPTPSPTPLPVTVSGANELGRVPILMYHAFVFNEENAGDWTITFDQFREQLDWLYENDFVAVGIQEMLTREFDIPAGKRPVILTFDDASGGQFRLRPTVDGGHELHPDTAVGVMEEYRANYPGFIQTAMFAVVPANCFPFPDEEDESTCEERLTWLIDHGYEISNHTMTHQNLSLASDERIKEEVFEPLLWYRERIAGPYDQSEVLVLPFGMYPEKEDQIGWLFNGVEWKGEFLKPSLVLEVAGGPARSPWHHLWGPNLTRYNTDQQSFWYWAEQIKAGYVDVFVSDGNPETVTIPEGWDTVLNKKLVEAEGQELIITPKVEFALSD